MCEAAGRSKTRLYRSLIRRPDPPSESIELCKHGILEGRREGTSVFYTVRDPRIFQLLEVSRQILTSSLTESQAVLGELTTPS
jgi:hypothetical protein